MAYREGRRFVKSDVKVPGSVCEVLLILASRSLVEECSIFGQAVDGIQDVTGVRTCALPLS